MTERIVDDNKHSVERLCQRCKKRQALVHLSAGVSPSGRPVKAKQYCKLCADAYFAKTPGMNSSRDLIQLSGFYRTKLLDELESQHPEVFDNSSEEACWRASQAIRRFLKRRLATDKIKVNDDGFEMLWSDLNCSHHFYDRAEKLRQKSGS